MVYHKVVAQGPSHAADDAKENEEQLNEVDVVLPQELFPKQHEHYEDLMKGDPTECTFKNIKLYPGWMVSNEIEEVDDGTRKKKKVIKWLERTPADCLEELAVLCETIANKMESRYTKSITEAAVILGNCLHLPDICALLQGTADQFTAQQRAALEGYGKADFHIFYNYVCTLHHIMQLADEKPELRLSLFYTRRNSWAEAEYSVQTHAQKNFEDEF